MKVPSTLLHRYFDTASDKLQDLIDSPLPDETPSPSEMKIDWHRNRVVQAQIYSLDEVLLDCKDGNRHDVQLVLREIGEGDFSRVTFEADDACGDEDKLTELMDETNDLARKAFSTSVFFVEWYFDHHCTESRILKGQDCELDKACVLEFCALAMSAVRIDSVRQFLVEGKDIISFQSKGSMSKDTTELNTVKGRLEYVHSLIWRALGWADNASTQLQRLFSEENQCTHNNMLLTDGAVMETLAKYASAMAVAINNATPLICKDDGTTRIINVSYSEKIVTVPQHMNEEDTTIASLSAPVSYSIHDHSSAQQRQQLDIAQKTSLLQQEIWQEFQSMSRSEQTTTLERAEIVQKEFLERVMNTPPGPERVLLMQDMSAEDQRLLVVHKLWISHNSHT
jgi:hypothetical protein